jgi:hypothetical protein
MRNTGEWTATVVQGGDFIRLHGSETKDPHWGTSSTDLGNHPAFDGNYPVSGSTTTLSGNGIIYFRVGMAGRLSHVGAQPRYGIIEVTTSTSTSTDVKTIYVRQGEEADYIMRPDDPNPAASGGMRPYAVRFSPFNLTDPQRGTGGGHVYEHNNMPLGLAWGNRKFTGYPSQAG